MLQLNAIVFGNLLTDLDGWLGLQPGSIGGYAVSLITGIIILLVGFFIVGQVTKLLDKRMKKRGVDETLRPFLKNVLKYILLGLVVIIAASQMGLEMTSLVGVIASLGLAIGLALQGALSNFAGGILIMILKPFQKEDLIEAQGQLGFVQEVNIISTSLLTLDNRTIFIPNGPLAGGTIMNYTKEKVRRVDQVFGISYSDDIEKARQIILKIANDLPQVIESPEPPFVRVVELADSSVNFTCRLWCKTDDYWDVYFHMNEEVKKAFDAQGVSIPFPQMDVHQYPAG